MWNAVGRSWKEGPHLFFRIWTGSSAEYLSESTMTSASTVCKQLQLMIKNTNLLPDPGIYVHNG